MPKAENKHTRRRLAGAWLSSLISISLVLLLVGAAALLVINSSEVSRRFKDQIKLSVVLSDSLSDEEAEAFGTALSSVKGVSGTELISRERGREEMSEMLGGEFLDIFEDAVIPVSYDVTLSPEYVAKDSVLLVKEAIEALPEVDSVNYDASFVEAALRNVGYVAMVLAVVIALLLFISFVLIGNTVRVNVFARRFTIHTMKTVGATKSFIRRPFVWRAVLQGSLAALISFGCLLALAWLVRRDVPALSFAFELRPVLLAGGVMLVSGILICVVSTVLSVNRLLSLPKDQLYY